MEIILYFKGGKTVTWFLSDSLARLVGAAFGIAITTSILIYCDRRKKKKLLDKVKDVNDIKGGDQNLEKLLDPETVYEVVDPTLIEKIRHILGDLTGPLIIDHNVLIFASTLIKHKYNDIIKVVPYGLALMNATPVIVGGLGGSLSVLLSNFILQGFFTSSGLAYVCAAMISLGAFYFPYRHTYYVFNPSTPIERVIKRLPSHSANYAQSGRESTRFSKYMPEWMKFHRKITGSDLNHQAAVNDNAQSEKEIPTFREQVPEWMKLKWERKRDQSDQINDKTHEFVEGGLTPNDIAVLGLDDPDIFGLKIKSLKPKNDLNDLKYPSIFEGLESGDVESKIYAAPSDRERYYLNDDGSNRTQIEYNFEIYVRKPSKNQENNQCEYIKGKNDDLVKECLPVKESLKQLKQKTYNKADILKENDRFNKENAESKLEFYRKREKRSNDIRNEKIAKAREKSRLSGKKLGSSVKKSDPDTNVNNKLNTVPCPDSTINTEECTSILSLSDQEQNKLKVRND